MFHDLPVVVIEVVDDHIFHVAVFEAHVVVAGVGDVEEHLQDGRYEGEGEESQEGGEYVEHYTPDYVPFIGEGESPEQLQKIGHCFRVCLDLTHN